MTRTPKPAYDALIVGARCAGAATAMLLARAGKRVLVVDREADIGDTLSTHALMRPAIMLLHQWGLLGRVARVAPLVTQTQFIYGDDRFPIPVKPEPGIPGLFAPRRYALDTILGKAAREAGAEVRTGTIFRDVIRDADGRVTGARLMDRNGDEHTVTAGLVIGADGRNSAVARSVEAATLRHSDTKSAVLYAYVDGIANEGYRWYYGNGHYAGLIPTNDGQHCLFTACKPSEFKARYADGASAGMLDMLAQWEPDVSAMLARKGDFARTYRYLGAPGHIRQGAGPGWALVGDAGYFKDPGSAHGITDAFLDAQRLADAILSGAPGLKSYTDARDHAAAPMFEVSQEIAAMTWSIPEVQVLHKQLADCMKAEGAELTNRFASEPALAA